MVINRISIQILQNEKGVYESLSNVLNLRPTDLDSEFEGKFGSWMFSKETKDDAPYFDFINEFLDILEPNFSQLDELEINRNDISLWHLYEYENQCNMEFHPSDLKRLGECVITLCISCWEK